MNKDIKCYVTLNKRTLNKLSLIDLCRLQDQVLKILVVAFFKFAIPYDFLVDQTYLSPKFLTISYGTYLFRESVNPQRKRIYWRILRNKLRLVSFSASSSPTANSLWENIANTLGSVHGL